MYQDSWTPVSDTYLMMMVAASGAELIARATAEESHCSNNPLEPVFEMVAAMMEEVVAEEEAALCIPIDNSLQEPANPAGTAVETSWTEGSDSSMPEASTIAVGSASRVEVAVAAVFRTSWRAPVGSCLP